jgi:hypothetical protein
LAADDFVNAKAIFAMSGNDGCITPQQKECGSKRKKPKRKLFLCTSTVIKTLNEKNVPPF